MPKDYWKAEDLKEVRVPEHLDLDIIKGALYIHNADDQSQANDRIEFLAKKLGDHKMTYVMALLILPMLMDNMTKSVDYTNFLASRKKTIN